MHSEPPFKRPREVGQYPANPWGFFDTVGNVQEWTETETDIVAWGNSDLIFRQFQMVGSSYKSQDGLYLNPYTERPKGGAIEPWFYGKDCGFRVALKQK